ncbi:hypothetical protein D3C86_1109350 [compost metagenome]
MQIVVIVADNGHAFRREADRLAEAQNHAGLRLGAVTAVISRDEIDVVFETEADGRLSNGVFIVAGGDAELVAARLQPCEKCLEIGHRHGFIRSLGEQPVKAGSQFPDIAGRARGNQTGGNFRRVAGGQQAVRHHMTGNGVHAAGGEKPVGENGIALGRDGRKFAVHRSPAGVIT